ncbi:hypothetical protein DRN67_00910 [Candidatus Micrarchaeota archaeon]|nr:MAG: hypothetical protein DRN67_00910 [Candidatus Micrarchaeota archaeon]
MYHCTRCGRQIESWDGNYFSRGMLCPVCYAERRRKAHEKSAICTRCGIRTHPRNVNTKLGRTLCKQCYEDLMEEKKENFCVVCGKRIKGASFQREDGYRVCLDCMRDQFPGSGSRMGVRRCSECGKRTILQYVAGEGKYLCPSCKEKHTSKGVLKKLMDAIGRIRH